MKSKTFYLLVGLVLGIASISIIGANSKRHCVCNPAGCHWVSGLALGQTPAPDSMCGGAEKIDPTATAMPRIPTATLERPTAVKVEPSQTPITKIIITQPAPGVTPEKRVEPTATPGKAKATEVPGNQKIDPKLVDPAITPCASCQQCPDIRCSLATIAAAQATQAYFVAEMP